MAEACAGPAAQHGRLLAAARRLLDAFRNACDDATHAFPSLDLTGRPLPNAVRELNVQARMTYCFALGHLVGSPGSRELAERGVAWLLDRHRDGRYGGYYSAVAPDGVRDSSKRCYEHAFVLLAAAAARIAGIDRARTLFDDAAQIIDERFWAEDEGRYREDFTEDWQPRSPYRGQNSNMHMTEALLASADATGDRMFLIRALSVAERLIRGSAARNGWRIPEHYDPSWRPRPDYHRDRPFDPYRPYGTIPGHSWEWARLLIQLRNALPRASDWCPPAATKLYAQAFADAWDLANGHPSYTVDERGAPVITDVVWWPVAEAIGASAMLVRATDDDQYTDDYTRLWAYADRCLIDQRRGIWIPVHVPNGENNAGPWGELDLYHALQAHLLPLCPAAASVAGGMRAGSYDGQ